MVITENQLRLWKDTGELLAFEYNDDEITRCGVNDWIDSKEPDCYDGAADVLRTVIRRLHDSVDNMCILKPYSFVLENDDREHVSELYLVDSDIKIIGGDLMKGLDEDLDKFLDDLLR